MNQIKVTADQPIRLDRYLRKIYTKLTQGVIEKSLRTGHIKLNSKKAKTSDRVNNGDIISAAKSMEQFIASVAIKTFSTSVKSLADKLLSEYLIFESEYFFAINKPSGLAVQGGTKISLSIDDALQYLNQETDQEYKIVHRLDKNTSGILLIAKGMNNSAKIGAAFQEKIIQKLYVAVVHGCPTNLEGELRNYIGKNPNDDFEIVKELPDGKLAITKYKVLSGGKAQSLIEFQPLTGRMHQLRFHSKYMGCPIVGDVKYGGEKHTRMLLHAKKLTIPSLVFGKEFIIESAVEF